MAFVCEACVSRDTLTWSCSPGRRRNNTSSRATFRAAALPKSSSTHARARSIPAEMPAEV